MPRKPANKGKAAASVQSHSRVQPKRRATGKNKELARDTPPPGSSAVSTTGTLSPPPVPIHPINSHNQLHVLPRGMKRQAFRPWYFYDVVEPAPRFRPIPREYKGKEVPTEVSEGEYSDDLSDHPGQGKLPVSQPRYLYKYAIKIPWEKEELDATLFEYGQEDIIEIEVRGTRRDPWHPEVIRSLGAATHHKIHAGYHHVLLGFNREIKLILEDKDGDDKSRFRCQYLMRVLDAFVEELKKRTVLNPPEFRSRALNPIIQRQRREVTDNDSDEVKEAVGTSYEDAANFYIGGDSLDPKESRVWPQHLLHTTPVHWSLGNYKFQGDTDVRPPVRQDPYDGFPEWVLLPAEIALIKAEGLEKVYGKLMKDSEMYVLAATKRKEGNPPADDGEEMALEDPPPADESHGEPVKSTPAEGPQTGEEAETSVVEEMLL